MKKIMSVALILVSVLSAETTKEDKDFERYANTLTTKKISKLNIVKTMPNELFITKNKMYDIIRENKNDEHLKKALYTFYNKTEVKHFKKKDISIPKYVPTFDELEQSVKENNNILSSYIGLNILQNYFLVSSKNIVAKKYTRNISKGLAKAGYPLGLFWYGRSFMKDLSPSGRADYKKAIMSYNRAIKNIDKKIKENTLKDKDKKRLLRFKELVKLAKGRAAGMKENQEKIDRGERTKIKRKIDLSKYKRK